jgi:membrane-associated phospholipid phosphatase
MDPVTATPEAPTLADTAHPGPTRRFLAATIGYIAVFWALYVVFVGTEQGQRFENSALLASTLRGDTVRADSLTYLSGVSVVTFAGAMAVVALVGLLRRRPGLGVLAAGAMGVTALAAEILKMVLERPALVDGPVWILRNSFPSGTAAIAAAVGLGALMVCPDRLRWIVLVIAAVLAAFVGQATQVTGWHRASDALAGVVLAGSVASAALVLLARSGHAQTSAVGRVHPRVFVAVVLVAGATILVGLTLLLAFVAFPLLRAPDEAESAFLQTASNLMTFGLSVIAIAAFAWVIEPFTLGTTAVDAAGLDAEASATTAGTTATPTESAADGGDTVDADESVRHGSVEPPDNDATPR